MGGIEQGNVYSPIQTQALDDVQALFDNGFCLQAYTLAERVMPLTAWRGERARVLAGDLAKHLGASRLGRLIHYQGFREYPHSSELFYRYIGDYYRRCGAYATHNLLSRHADLLQAQGPLAARWLIFLARIEAFCRDFSSAEQYIRQAFDKAEDEAGNHLGQSHVYEQEDKYELALGAVEEALRLRPHYAAAVRHKAHVLQLLGFDDQAYRILSEGASALECEGINAQLLLMQMQAERYDEAEENLKRLDRLTPLKDDSYQQWLGARRADLSYYRGDLVTAIEQGAALTSAFYRQLSKNLAQAQPDACAVMLDVAFVRQHHLTCAPATLSALTCYLGRGTDHDTLVEAMGALGTTDYHERRWAELDGWWVREFRLDWAASVALLDRGIPFALATVDPGDAHLQAVIGYDSRRGSLFIRDPRQSHYQEYLAESLFDRYRASGPRAMVLVPKAQAALIEGIVLAEVDLYDAYYSVQDALHQHRREQAQSLVDKLRTEHPRARLSAYAAKALAIYDNDEIALLEATVQLQRAYPKDVNLQLNHAESLRRLGRLDERFDYLQTLVDAGQADVHIVIRYADLLAQDARRHLQTQVCLRRLLRQYPAHAEAYHALANLHWRAREFSQASDLYRRAASLHYENEYYALDYFKAARFLREGEGALQWLEDRYKRLLAHSSYAARTLYTAYRLLGREHDGLHKLEAAMRLRPDDGDFLLFCAEVYAQNGRRTQAEQLLAQAQPITQAARWLVARADLYHNQHQLEKALGCWHQVVELEPHQLYAHHRIASILDETQGRSAALAHIEQLSQRFVHDHTIYTLWLRWLDRARPQSRERVLRALLQINPHNAWALGRLALTVAEQGHVDEGFAVLRSAQALDPRSCDLQLVHAELLLLNDEPQAAKEVYRQVIGLSVDNQEAVERLLALCHSREEKQSALSFIRHELIRQVTHGDGLLAYQAYAQDILDAEVLLNDLQQAWCERDDLWQSWSALTQQFWDMGRIEPGLEHARRAIEKFPLLFHLWMDLAQGYQLKGDYGAEQRALRSALEIHPDGVEALLKLGKNLEHSGEFEQARTVLKSAVTRHPVEPYLRVYLADVLWHLGEREAALVQVEKAIDLMVDLAEAWERLKRWSLQMKKTGYPEQIARRSVEKHPGDANAWLVLAQMIDDIEQALALVEKSITLSPRNLNAQELKIQYLTELKRYDEAQALIVAPFWGECAPVSIRGYGPWILKRRGQAREAVEALKQLLQTEPGFIKGWQMLARWSQALGNERDVLQANQRYLDLRPNDPQALTYLGDALCRAGNIAQAMDCFRRAVALAPSFGYAVVNLFDLQLKTQDMAQAEQTLDLMRKHGLPGETPAIEAREIRLACKNKQAARAVQCVERLCHTPQVDRWALDAAINAFEQAAWADTLDHLLEQIILHPAGVHPEVGLAWAQWKVRRNDLDLSAAQVKSLMISGAIGVNVVDTYLEALAESAAWFRLANIIRYSRALLHANTTTWSTIAYLYARRGRFRKVIRWMHDWQQREDAPLWSLNNLATAYRERGHWKQAWRVGLRLLEKDPGEYADVIQVWVGLESGLIGDMATMNACYEAVDPQSLNEANRFIYVHMAALHYFDGLAPAHRRGATGKLREMLHRAVALYPPYRKDRPAAAMRRRVLAHIARRMANVPLSWWQRWQLGR